MKSWERDNDLILAVDPGPESSGVVLYGGESHQLFYSGDMENRQLLLNMRQGGAIAVDCGDGTHTFVTPHFFAIEDIVSMGMAVGKTTFGTCKWIGRFIEAYENSTGTNSDLDKIAHLVSRRDVKVVLAGGNTYEDPVTGARRTVNDSFIKQLIRDRFEPTGGGKNPTVGTKKEPGPLFGLKAHSWSAMAVALTFKEIRK